ncbi:M23 family metallopeptidase [Bacillus sp. AFS017336]|uniref:M23 family metallopeptidase n=1 Tax=Bacillus sp. AFS017336 TaxID=2033489 RepID=UPI000BEF7881|nr:M23 family metallopeptidase [Bacillus sp. AFS017336]PEL13805.1 hypothetical protein CN601_03580 [Bacillus sp. AFS017336]
MKVNITCRYGEISNSHPHGHTGIDFGFPEGTPIHAIKSGVAHVVDYGHKNIGKGVIIKHSDGSKDIYGHLSEIDIKEGQHIYAGDEIGLTGNTGHSTGAHLHFGMKDSQGHYIDPSHHINGILSQAKEHHWYDFLTTAKSVIYNIAVDPKGWLYEQVVKFVEGAWIDILQNCIIALPFCAIVGGSVYILVNLFSKKLAKASFISTVIYGMIIANMG